MLNNRLYTIDGEEIYPLYISKEAKAVIRNKYNEMREYMWCGCRHDVKIYYRISSDLRLYPEKKNSEHASFCIFSDKEFMRKRSGYVADGETGEMTAYLKFNPSNFNIPYNKSSKEDIAANDDTEEQIEGLFEIEEKNKNEKERKKQKEKKAPFLSLGSFIRAINVDTFNERMAQHKSILSKEYFTSAIFGRTKNIKIAGLTKYLRDYTLKDDGFQFFYTYFMGYTEKKYDNGRTSYFINIKGKDGVIYNYFIYEKTLLGAIDEFVKNYGYSPEGEDVMMAGFRYVKEKKASNITYKVVGRLHLFLVSKNGIYARTKIEKANIDLLMDYIKEKGQGKIFFFLSQDDVAYSGVFELSKYSQKALLINEKRKETESFITEVFDIMTDSINITNVEKLLGKIIEGN